MEIGITIIFSIYKIAQKIGLIDYIKKLPEKTVDAVYEKLVQDKLVESTFLNRFFEPKLDRVFNSAFEHIAPINESIKRRFILAVLTDPTIVASLEDFKIEKELPQKQILISVFQRVLPHRNAEQDASQFLTNLKDKVSEDEKLALRVLLNLPEKVDASHGLLLEIFELLKRFTPTPEKEEKFKISLAKLPITSPVLFGREEELKLLDAAWENEGTNIVSLVAWGGVGKTALVNVWLNQMGTDHFRGAERVLGYSFYSQGAAEGKQASADPFINFALTWFGDPDPTRGSPWDKGVRLAGLICKQRTLIILDGLEPVQYPPGVMEGRLKDPALQSLLRELMRHNPGLCIITTRLTVADLQPCEGSTVLSKNLEHLSTAAGAQLLSHLDVKGKAMELQTVADEFDGHALTLTLLGRYLAVAYQGDIRQRDRIGRMTKEKKQGAHAFKVMEAYERWFKDQPELNILYLMGLFDRPAPGGAMAVLRAAPAIQGLTAALVQLPDEDWRYALDSLREVRLLAKQDPDDPDTLDCHPLIREHFSQKLREKAPGAWRMAHERLYEYYKNLPKEELPDNLEEMEPLFAAVAHGCQAGKHQEIFDDVYWKRISRGGDYYTFHKLGAFGSDLAALSNFFEELWSKPNQVLIDSDKAITLSIAGFTLRALGRLRDAAQPMQAAVDNFIKQKDLKQSAINAGNLSELYLTLGDVEAAVSSARQSVEFADRSGDGFMKETMRTTLADALQQAGELAQAEDWFRQAEAMQGKRQPEYRYLYSLRGFRFCDLLLAQGKVQEVLERAKQTIEIAIRNRWLLDISLDKLSLGRAYLLEAVAGFPPRGGIKGGVLLPNAKTSPSILTPWRISDLQRGKLLDQAADYLNQAVAGLRQAGYQSHLPLGLFARAFCYRVQNQFPQAWDDLEEAREIAERGDMKLWMVDYHLEAGRIVNCQLSVASLQSAGGGFEVLVDGREVRLNRDEMIGRLKLHVEQADKLVQETGYRRRSPEVELGYAGLFLAQGDLGKTREHLARGKSILDEKGIRCWDFWVEQLSNSVNGFHSLLT